MYLYIFYYHNFGSPCLIPFNTLMLSHMLYISNQQYFFFFIIYFMHYHYLLLFIKYSSNYCHSFS